MKILGIILLVLVAVAGAVWIGTKFFKLTKDEDNDGIPDKAEEVVAEVKKRARTVKAELKDVVEEAKDVVEASKDVAKAVKGKARRGRPRKTSTKAKK